MEDPRSCVLARYVRHSPLCSRRSPSRRCSSDLQPPSAYGTDDGNGHPYVGLMVAQNADGNPLWRCSGTLLSATVFLTAGHCVEAPAAAPRDLVLGRPRATRRGLPGGRR